VSPGAPPQDGSSSTRSADDDLVGRLRRGDGTAFAELVRRHHASMLRVAATYVAGPADAEDVVQETWLAVVRGLDAFEGRSSLRTWIFTILVNRARTHGAREAKRPGAQDRIEVLGSGDVGVPADRFSGAPGTAHWREPVTAWQDDPHLRLAAKEVEGVIAEAWSAAEVAALLGISDANQRVLLHRARNAVRLRLEKERARWE
jgi:RNA polymerase sigma-70 factor (ECF subfamily)